MNASEIHELRHVDFFDTTLRDGEQSPGYSMTIDQKVRLALALEELGMNTIETGFPISSPTDFEATRQICKQLKKAKPCGFARALKKDVEACAEAMKDAVNPQIEIASLGSDIHVLYKRKITREKVLTEALAAVKHAKAVGFTDISLAFEDASRSDMEFLKYLVGKGMELGITTIAIPDTVGCCLPEEFYELIKGLREFTGNDCRISIHCHNDMGLAVINSLAGIRAGADEVQTTLCGIGERAGNACLEEIISVLNTKQHVFKRVHDIITHKLFDACHLLVNTLDLPLPRHKPIIGENAFSTEAGMHQQGVIVHRFTYEWLRAEDYGTVPRIAVGRHSGRNIIIQCLKSSGINSPHNDLVETLYKEHVEKASRGSHFEPNFWATQYRELQTKATQKKKEKVKISA